MLTMTVTKDSIYLGERFAVSFQRTLRVPDDGSTYPLPPGLGSFPVHRVEDYAERVPEAWRKHGGVFIPMYQREALWLVFSGADWKPNAVKVAVGKINAISGGAWNPALRDDPQDYIVCPDQPWLDGINAGEGFVRQFVATPLGAGYTVEGQLTGKETFGGIQILVYEPKPGRFPDAPPPPPEFEADLPIDAEALQPEAMGIAAGGKLKQKIYPDPYGVDTWDPANRGSVFVHILNTEQYRDVTGLEPPATPVSAQLYTAFGLPWFDLYDEGEGDVRAPEALADVKSIGEIDVELGGDAAPEEPGVEVDPSLIRKLRRKRGEDERS
jgi:hypothetical protein